MMNRIVQAAKGALLIDAVGAIGLSLKYMARPKMTVNYPFERNPKSPRSCLTANLLASANHDSAVQTSALGTRRPFRQQSSR